MKTKGNATVIMIIITLLIMGLVFLFLVRGFGLGQNLFKKTDTTQDVGPLLPEDAQIKLLEKQSSSDEISAIEKDINETQLDDLDNGIEQVDEELTTNPSI